MDDQQNQSEEVKQVQESVVLDLKEIRDLQRKAKKQLETVQQLTADFEVLKEKLTNPQGGIEANVLTAQQGNEKIQVLKTNSDQLLSSIQSQAQQIDTSVAQASTQVDRIASLVKQSETDSTNIQQTLTQVTASKTEVEAIKTTATQRLATIEESYQTILKNLESVRQAYEAFIAIKAKIDDPANGLDAALTLSNKLKNEIAEARASAEDSLRQVKKHQVEIGATKTHTDKTRQEIEQNKKTSEEFKDQIGEILKLVTDGSLADGFDTRKKELGKSAIKWLVALVVAWVLLVIAVIYFFQLIPGKQELLGWEILYRIAFTSPFIFAVIFCTQQHGKTRDLLEKYAFKLTVSLSLQSYIKLLNDSFPEKDFREHMLQFTLSSIGKIYKEPYLEKNRKYAFGINKIFNVGIEETDLNELGEKIISTLSEKAAEKK